MPDNLNLAELNQEQLAAVTAQDGPTLVIAGAGSGKTKVLVSRAAYLMRERNIAPYNLLAVTFTNKAANEMKERLENLTGLNMRWIWIGTFHSICARILRMESEHLPYESSFLIYDTADCRSLMKKCISAQNLDLDDKQFTPAGVLAAISQAKNSLIPPEDYSQYASNYKEEVVAELYTEYQRRLRQNCAMDFDDLLTETVWLFKRNPQIIAKYQERFQHILVDEYQDTNQCQYEMVKLLAGKTQNVFVVGDPDQSIYGWRGADIRNILDFQDDYPSCTTLKLVRNYRSTQNILDASNHLIANNEGRFEKDLITENGAGEKILFHFAENDKGEARFVINHLHRLREQENYQLKDMAVLYRTHAQSRLFEDECVRFGIPYRVYGGIRFYERKEIKDSLAYLRLVANPADGESLTRIYNEPRRGIGKTTWDKVVRDAAKRDVSLFTMLGDSADIADLGSAAQKKLALLYQMIDAWRDFVVGEDSIARLLEKIWEDSGYMDALSHEENGEERKENLEQLYNLAAEFDAQVAEDEEFEDEPLLAFLNQLSLATDMDEDSKEENYLTLMTLHAAKGLEFPVVFMGGLEEGLFPHSRALDAMNKSDLEEERRLCYVGMTRAKERLILSAAAQRLVWGKYTYGGPSSFIQELPEELLEISGYQPKAKVMQAVNQERSSNIFKQSAPALQPKAETLPALVNVGDKVVHAKFGAGVIVSASGAADDLMVKVAFPNEGIKELLWRYAPIKKA